MEEKQPGVDEATRDHLVKETHVGAESGPRCRNATPKTVTDARRRVDKAKVVLGERGPIWWTDGAPDYNTHMVKNTPYADWFASIYASPAPAPS
jgi:hypothetical protein